MKLKIQKTEWDLSPLLKGDNDPSIVEKRKATEEASYKFINKWKSRKDYLEKAEVLKEALDEYENLFRGIFGEGEEGSGGIENYYFWLRTQQDLNNPEIKAKYNQAEEFSRKIANDMLFFELNLGKTPIGNQKKFLESQILKNYRYYHERLFKKSRHWLSEEGEKIMNLKHASAYENWIKMVSGFISNEEREVLTEEGKKAKKNFEEISGLMNNQNKEVRDIAAEAFNDIMKNNLNVAEVEINSILGNKKVDDELRKFERSDDSRLLSDDIDREVVEALLEAVSSKFEIAKKYYKLKAALFKIPKLKYHERNVSYGKLDKKYSYEESVELVYEVLSNLDSKFGEIFKRFVENGQIDVFPRKGKRSGAFCVYWLISHPVYVMLNHTDEINDVRTLAHEMGHAINNELIKEKQNSLYYGTSTATGEVASTFMEDFVSQKLMKEADDELKLALMIEKLNSNISSIFRQIAFYNFERELHNDFRKKGYLSKEEIGKIFQKHMESYMGEGVEQSPGVENWWTYVSHFRMFFYTYSYSSGLLISKALQAEVKKNPKFIEKVKEFLSAGKSDSPKNIFSKLGVDITKREFWDKGLNEVENLLVEAEKLAKELGKI